MNIADMELSNVTIEDCIELYQYKGITTIINDGNIINFEKEK